MAVGIFRKIKDTVKAIGEGAAKVLATPAKLYHNYVAGKLSKIPVLGELDSTFDRVARSTIKASQGKWKEAGKELWDGGRLITDAVKAGTAIAPFL